MSSRVAASTSSFPSPVGDTAAASPTLAELMRCVSDLAGNDEVIAGDVESQLGDDAMMPRRISFTLVFQNLTYSVKARRKSVHHEETLMTKTILDEISGEACEGEVMAVMGASGSGKSTLIDALANRMAKGSLKGSVTLNGEQLESTLLKTISAYVMQDDLLFPMLTVEETLTFAAEFRLPRILSTSKKKLRVQALIDQLGLRKAANTLIGDEGHCGVSGGERRRVSIGTDIIHDPILLFLDEPTSGLDSTSAFMVVKVLQRIAKSGSIIIMSIHQPSHRILKLFDRMIFLSHGKIVYSGTPQNLPVFFSDLGHPIPDSENWADFALDLIRELEDNPGGTKKLVEFYKSWQPLKTGFDHIYSCSSLKEAITTSISRGKLFSGGGPKSVVPKFANPVWIELAVLLKRSFTNFRRTPKMFAFRVATIAVTGIILATVFLRLDDTPKGIQERLGFFAFTMAATFYTCADALPIFIQERYIFMRETSYNAYRRSSYVFSITLVFLPVLLILSSVLATVTFWAVGLDGNFLFYFLIIFASYWAGNSFVIFLSGVVPEVILGYIIVVALLGYSLLFSGFFINRDRIPNLWIWFHYISLIKYPFEAVLKNEFHGSRKCFVQGVQMFDGTQLASAPDSVKNELLGYLGSIGGKYGVKITAETCVATAEDILRRQGVSDLSKWGCLWVTVGWGFFFRILFYLSLLIGSKNKRR